jgi:hypothetical protein
LYSHSSGLLIHRSGCSHVCSGLKAEMEFGEVKFGVRVLRQDQGVFWEFVAGLSGKYQRCDCPHIYPIHKRVSYSHLIYKRISLSHDHWNLVRSTSLQSRRTLNIRSLFSYTVGWGFNSLVTQQGNKSPAEVDRLGPKTICPTHHYFQLVRGMT